MPITLEPLEPRRLLAAAPLAVGGGGFDGAYATAVDDGGATIVAGLFSGTADFAPGRPRALATARGDTDAFVAKYSPDGGLAWLRTFGGDTSEDELEERDERDFPINPQRLGSFATPVGAQPFEAGEYVNGLAVGRDGDVFVAGSFRGAVDFARGLDDAGTNPASGGDYAFVTEADDDFHDAYVLRLDADTGAPVYAATFAGRFDEVATGVAVDRFGNATVSGYFTRSTDFNPSDRAQYAVPAVGRDDSFVARLSVRGRLAWVSRFGGETVEFDERESANAVALSPDGALAYVGGTFVPDEARFVGGVTPSAEDDDGLEVDEADDADDAGATDGYVAALDNATGALVWLRQAIVGEDADGVVKVAAGPDGSVYAAGYFEEEADVDPGPALREFVATPEDEGDDADQTDLVIQRFTGGEEGGDLLWAAQLAGDGYETVGGLAVDEVGSVYLAGGFYGTLDLAPGGSVRAVESIEGREEFDDDNSRDDRDDSYDGFVVYLSPAGRYLNGASLGGAGDDFLTGVALGPSNTFAAVGLFGRQTDDPFGGAIDAATGPFADAAGLDSGDSEAALILAMLNRPGFAS